MAITPVVGQIYKRRHGGKQFKVMAINGQVVTLEMGMHGHFRARTRRMRIRQLQRLVLVT